MIKTHISVKTINFRTLFYIIRQIADGYIIQYRLATNLLSYY